MNITIVGSGNGGQAMAGHFALLGHSVTLLSRNLATIPEIANTRQITLFEKLDGVAQLKQVTDNVDQAVDGAELIMVTTTADAHRAVAEQLAPHLEDNQVVVLNPGRTLGAIEFRSVLQKQTAKKITVAEAQTLLYACRAEAGGRVRVIGVKDKVLVASLPATETDQVVSQLNAIFPAFVKAESVLHTSLENIGAIFHPTIVLCNAQRIEQGEVFNFYSDITPSVARLVEAVDKERLAIGESLDLPLRSALDWINFAYSYQGGASLRERIHQNPAYSQISSPSRLDSRYLVEDIPTGILPMVELAQLTGVKTPLLSAILSISQALLGIDFSKTGRTLQNLGLQNITKAELLTRL